MAMWSSRCGSRHRTDPLPAQPLQRAVNGIHAVVSLRAYADGLLVVGPDGRQVRLARSFERDQTLYDWMHITSR